MELSLSIVALAFGPLLFPVVKRHPQFLCGMDGFVFVSILGLSLFHLMPAAIEHAGWWTLLAAVAGILGPFIFGRNLHHLGQRKVHNIFILIAVAGLGLHAMIDGAAIFHGTQGGHLEHVGHSHGMAEDVRFGGMVAAVLIHRVPMSLLIWWSLQPRMGNIIASAALGILGIATVAGYWVGGEVMITPVIMGYLIAFVAGSLMHVVGHDTASELIPRHCQDRWHATYSAMGGALAAVGLLYFGHLHDFDNAWARFSSIFIAAAPALLVGFTLGGLMETSFGSTVLNRFRGKTSFGSAFRGVFFGTPIPICSCGVETVYEDLCRRGIPIAAAVAFLVAAPSITLDSLALSIKLLGVELTVARLLFTVLVALVVAMLVVFWGAKNEAPEQPTEASEVMDKLSLGAHARESLAKGWVEQIDHVAPWIVVGFAAVALSWPLVQNGLFDALPAALEVVVLTLLATPFYLNASGLTAMAAAMLAGGVSLGAVLAMLVASPSLNIAALVLLKKLHGARTMWLVLGGGLATIMVFGFLFNLAQPDSLNPVALSLPTEVFLGEHSALEYTAAAVLTALFLLSYLRMGPRGMLLQLMPVGHHHMHDHGHDEDDHEHDHADDDHCHHH